MTAQPERRGAPLQRRAAPTRESWATALLPASCRKCVHSSMSWGHGLTSLSVVSCPWSVAKTATPSGHEHAQEFRSGNGQRTTDHDQIDEVVRVRQPITVPLLDRNRAVAARATGCVSVPPRRAARRRRVRGPGSGRWPAGAAVSFPSPQPTWTIRPPLMPVAWRIACGVRAGAGPPPSIHAASTLGRQNSRHRGSPPIGSEQIESVSVVELVHAVVLTRLGRNQIGTLIRIGRDGFQTTP